MSPSSESEQAHSHIILFIDGEVVSILPPLSFQIRYDMKPGGFSGLGTEKLDYFSDSFFMMADSPVFHPVFVGTGEFIEPSVNFGERRPEFLFALETMFL
ncbi:MAG: hypothetical protein ABSF43_08150 [Rectinemataceae bacterium]|jgi:hypothetical protein